MRKQGRFQQLGCLLAACAILTCAAGGTASAHTASKYDNIAVIASSDEASTDPAIQYAITKGCFTSAVAEKPLTPISLSDFCYAAISVSKTTLNEESLRARMDYLQNLYVKCGLLPDGKTISNLDAISFLDRVWKLNSNANIELNIIGAENASLEQLDAISDMAVLGLIPNDPSFDASALMTYQDLANIIARYNGTMEKTNQTITLIGSTQDAKALYNRIASQYTSRQVLELFEEVALKCEYTDRTNSTPIHNLVRWTNRTITYSIIGDNISEETYTAIADTLAELDEIPYTPEFQLDETGTGALQIHVGDQIATQILTQYNANGFSSISYDKTIGSIVKGAVYIQNSYPTETRMKHVILEEMTQTLGLINDTAEFQDSIFYDGLSDIDHLTDMDRLLIELLYSDAVSPNMMPSQCKANLATWLSEHVYTQPAA